MNLQMTPQLIRIAEVYDDGEAARHFTFEPLDGARHRARPGQFFTLALPGHGEAAFTYLSLPDAEGRFSALIRRAGKLTTALFQCGAGDRVGFRGPFGNGWPLEQLTGRRLLIIAGGIGLPPLAAIAEQLAADDSSRIGLIYGSRTPAARVLKRERAAWTFPLIETFDHPARQGQRQGTPLAHLPEITAALGGAPEAVLTCGPEVMMHATARHFAEAGLPPERIWLALERRMHCGVGECGHCYLGSSYVCTDGPVYNWRQLLRLQQQTSARPAGHHS